MNTQSKSYEQQTAVKTTEFLINNRGLQTKRYKTGNPKHEEGMKVYKEWAYLEKKRPNISINYTNSTVLMKKYIP